MKSLYFADGQVLAMVKCCSCSLFQDLVLGSLEKVFIWYGRAVARYPAVAIVLALILTGICSIGFLDWKTENDGLKLWLPKVSLCLINLLQSNNCLIYILATLKSPKEFKQMFSVV